MILLAAAVMQTSAAPSPSPAADFYPLTPGTRRTYQVDTGADTKSTLIDEVGAKPAYFDAQTATAIVQKTPFGQTLSTTYYRVDGPEVLIVGYGEDRSSSTATLGNAGGPPTPKVAVLMQLTPPMPVFKYEGKETHWTYTAIPKIIAIGDANPVGTEETSINGVAKPGKPRTVLGHTVDTIEVRADVQLGLSDSAMKVVETSVYGKGIGLIEAVRKETANRKTRTIRTTLVSIEGGQGQ